jgi:hypothetical protein
MVEAILAHPAYFCSVCKIPGRDGLQPWELWDHQSEFLNVLAKPGPDVIGLKARQLGMSWSIAGHGSWFSMAHEARKSYMFSIGDREAMSLLDKARDLYYSSPPELQRARPLVTNTKRELAWRHPSGLISQLISLPSSAGRGETAHMLYGDEAAHWEDSPKRLAQVLPMAADIGRVVLVSTANGMKGRFYEIFANSPGNGWVRVFVGADARPDRSLEWVERERGKGGELGAQEYPLSAEEAFVSSGNVVFDLQALAWQRQHSVLAPAWKGRITIQDGKARARKGDDVWRVWEWPRPDGQYLITADACGGLGAKDYAYAAVIERSSWEQVAALHGRIPPVELAENLRAAGSLYRGSDGRPALVAPESNNHGQAVVATLREQGYPAIYQPESFDKRRLATASQLGWMTSVKTKALAIATLADCLVSGDLAIRDSRAVTEMELYEQLTTDSGNSRFSAPEGKHDDAIMAFGIAAAILRHSPLASPRTSSGGPRRYREVVDATTGY